MGVASLKASSLSLSTSSIERDSSSLELCFVEGIEPELSNSLLEAGVQYDTIEDDDDDSDEVETDTLGFGKEVITLFWCLIKFRPFNFQRCFSFFHCSQLLF